jgi:hypothetical protein
LSIIRLLVAARGAAIVSCLEAIHEHEAGPYSTHALPVGAGGVSLHSLERQGRGSHLGTYYRIAGALIARLLVMDGPTPRKAVEHQINPTARVGCPVSFKPTTRLGICRGHLPRRSSRQPSC